MLWAMQTLICCPRTHAWWVPFPLAGLASLRSSRRALVPLPLTPLDRAFHPPQTGAVSSNPVERHLEGSACASVERTWAYCAVWSGGRGRARVVEWWGGADPMSLSTRDLCRCIYANGPGFFFTLWHRLYLLRSRIQFLPLPNLEIVTQEAIAVHN
jgi:hypothetical protein